MAWCINGEIEKGVWVGSSLTIVHGVSGVAEHSELKRRLQIPI